MLPFRAAPCVTCFLDQDFLVTYAINPCLLCCWTSKALPHSTEGFGVGCGCFLKILELLLFWEFGIFHSFFHIPKWLQKLDLISWRQLECILCFTSFILILCHQDLSRKPPRVLIAVDKIYITFISPWIPKAIRISSLIFYTAFSPCHKDQVHIYQTPSKSSVLLCCFAISSIYDRTLKLVWLFLQFFLSLKIFLFWILLLIIAIILQVSVQSPSLMRGAHHQ